MDSPYQTLLSLKRGNTSLHVAAFMFPKIMKSLSCCTNCPMYSRKRLKGGFVATTSACSSNATHSRERKSPSPSRCTRELPGKAHRASTSNELSGRSEEHTSELQSLMRISYAVFCLKKKKQSVFHHLS